MIGLNLRYSTLFISLFSFFLFISLVGLLGYYQFMPESAQIAEVGGSQSVSLAFSLPPTPLFQNDEIVLPLKANSGDLHLTGLDTEINYDPLYLRILEVNASPDFASILLPAQYATSPIKFAYGVNPGSGGKTGEVEVATLKIKLLKKGATTLTFSDSTIATTQELSTNALNHPSPTSLSILGPRLSGDFNQDGKVDLLDFNLVIVNYGTQYNLLDFNAVVVNYGKTS